MTSIWIVMHGEFSDRGAVAAFTTPEGAQAWVDARTDLQSKVAGKSWYHGDEYDIEELEFNPAPREGPRKNDLFPPEVH